LSRQSEWLQRGENVLLFGSSGVGKPHIAIGMAMAQIGRDQPCRFYPATTLVKELQKALTEFNLPVAVERLDRWALFLIDDIGFV
jgi:DNA replication protein DnaC